MSIYYYFSVLPEALVASMLPPKEFCAYYAMGSTKQSRGQAILFGISADLESDYFNLNDIEERCAPHPDGTPKHSVYISIYRVLEHLPLESLKNLYLVTPDARALEIPKTEELPEPSDELRLYQELCPVQPTIASSLPPYDFCRFMGDASRPIHVPKILFADLRLGELARNPDSGSARDLPYSAVMHLRDCLKSIQSNPRKHTKTVDRIPPRKFPYRMIKTGFYIGGLNKIYYYPFPSEQELEDKHHFWWRSATM